MKPLKHAFTVFFVLTAGVLVGCNSRSPGTLSTVDLQPLEQQSYHLINSEEPGENSVKSLLIVTSADTTDAEIYANVLRRDNNLAQIIASHWNLTVDNVTVDEYTAGMINDYDALFLVETQDSLPIVVLDDIVKTNDKEIIFADRGAGSMLSYVARNQRWYPQALHNVWDEPAAEIASPATRVLYKGVEFSSSELDALSVFPLSLPGEDIEINVLATYEDNQGNEQPLIVDIEQRFLVMLFEPPHYYSIEDFSLVFLDTLHYALGHHEANQVALVRLEDVNPYTYRDTSNLQDVYSFFKQEQIPFHIALIVRYINPDKDIDLHTYQANRYLRMLKRMEGEGLGVIISHGYTHQITDISGVDYEFWDVESDSPLPFDSEEYVLDKLHGIHSEMSYLGMPVPDIFETPHYKLSELDNSVVNQYYPLRYEEIPGIGKLPFAACIDDRIYFPTNLGYVHDELDLQKKAELVNQISVFEDPVASFFWHPWRDPTELEYMVELLQSEGYEFVSVYDLVEADEPAGYYDIVAFRNSFKSAWFTLNNVAIDTLMVIVYLGFFSGVVLYGINVMRITRFQKEIRTWNLSLNDVRAVARKKERELPNLGILVPARNEGYVIGNTIRRLTAMDYPNAHYRVYIIVDERELDDDVEVFTKDVANELAAQVRFETGYDLVKIIEVPKWYSGEYGNMHYTDCRSTKGRALNFALETLRVSAEWNTLEMLGILDADGRLDVHVLKEVAYRRLKNGSKILQGSVFQVSNFSQVSIVGVVAGLELAIHHLTVLPTRLVKRKVQFLAGTNYFIDKNILLSVQGWDQNSLVEDAELALRIYANERTIAEWIRSPELEQSPANFKVYLRQRERWARGHLLLLRDIQRSAIPWRDKASFYSKVFFSQFRSLLDISFLLLALILISVGAFDNRLPIFKWVSIFLSVMSILIMDIYGMMYRGLAKYINPDMTSWQKTLQSLKLFFYFPVMIAIQTAPRVLAIYRFLFKHESSWYKTERTKEVEIDLSLDAKVVSGLK